MDQPFDKRNDNPEAPDLEAPKSDDNNFGITAKDNKAAEKKPAEKNSTEKKSAEKYLAEINRYVSAITRNYTIQGEHGQYFVDKIIETVGLKKVKKS